MITNMRGIDLIKSFEGFSARPYNDSAGLPTIGYGHLIKKGERFGVISKDEALDLLEADVKSAEDVVNHAVLTPLSQNQFNALVSFVYNVGPGREGVKDGFACLRNGNQSHMLRCLNAGDYDGAAAEFVKWDRAGGVVVQGLLNRRLAERDLFMAEDSGE